MPSAVDLGSVDAGVRSGQFEFRIINCGDTTRTVSRSSSMGAKIFLGQLGQAMMSVVWPWSVATLSPLA